MSDSTHTAPHSTSPLISIGKTRVGRGHPVFLIAEIGINFNGSLNTAKQLIRAAAKAGCNAAKFQLFTAKQMYPKSAGSVTWQSPKGSYEYDIYSAVEKNELPSDWLQELRTECFTHNLHFILSVFDEESLAKAVSAGSEAIKIGSSELTHIPLIRAAARTSLPLIISTGGATLSEVTKAYDVALQEKAAVAILHCNVQYPTPLESVHMNTLNTLQNEFPRALIGFSDHTKEPADAPVAAVCLGATIIEKHITLDRSSPGPDHFFALEPTQLQEMVHAVREAEQMLAQNKTPSFPQIILGSHNKTTYENEQYLRDFAYRCIFAARDIKAGEPLTSDSLAVLRPGKKKRGLNPEHFDELITMYRARQTIKAEQPITWKEVEKR